MDRRIPPQRSSTEASPYLLQHRRNPVHWWPWGQERSTAARAEHKPILLSIGYAACHWCHVMAHESFEDAETAKLLNADFISVKVDREERPDVDRLYMDALHALGEQGGWPLTMFLTPTARRSGAAPISPRRRAYGRPSFRQILTEIARLWQAEPGKIAANLAHIREALQRQPPAKPPVALSLDRLDAAGRLLLEAVDTSAWRLPRRPQIPPDPRLRIPLAALPAHRQPALPPGRHHHPDPSLPGRHLRPSRRRLCPLSASMPVGWCRISRRCCTTMLSCCVCSAA